MSCHHPGVRQMKTILTISVLALLAGCAQEPTPDPPQDKGYLAFSETHYQNQKARVAIYEQISALSTAPSFSAASFGALTVDPAAAVLEDRCKSPTAPAAGSIAQLYQQAGLCLAVAGMKEEHPYGEGFETDALGIEMHRAILAGLSAGGSATSPDRLEASAEAIKKTLLRFFYAGVYEEMHERYIKGWDEAFGYWGASNDGLTLTGLAATAKKRDDNFKTSLAQDVFSLFVRGRRVLAEAVSAEGQSPSDPAASVAQGASPELDQIIIDLDAKMLLIFAYSAAREWNLYVSEPTDRAIAYAEGVAFTATIEDYLKNKNPSGHAQLRAALDKAETAFTVDDAALCASTINATFGISTTP